MRGLTTVTLIGLGMLSSPVLASSDEVPTRAQALELSAQDRYSLLAGIQSRVGGRFVVSGLQDAAKTCEVIKTCITVDELRSQSNANSRLGAARGINAILDNVDVNGQAPKAIVSLRSVQYDNNDNPTIRLSILNATTGQWNDRIATLGYKALQPNITIAASNTKVLRSWQPVYR